MLEIFDRNRVPIARLENAFGITETRRINAINRLVFSLPRDDAKTAFCTPFAIVVMDRGEKFRIVKMSEAEGEDDVIQYECEHILGLLIDTALDGYHVFGGIGIFTREVLEYVLSFQEDWVLDECDFERQFEYGWEKETCLSALFSIPNRFVDKYIFRMDSTVYPYRLSLKRLDEAAGPVARARRGHNRISLTRDIDYTKIATRIIPYGAGEGINQLTIAEVNGGLPYVQSPASIVEKYGLITKIWVDRRYTDAESLLASAQVLLNELQEPFAEYEADFVGDADLGDVVEIVDVTRSYITEVKIEYGEDVKKTYTIANRTTDIAASLADLADRQNIETCYSQGATQIYADSMAENGDAEHPIELRFYVPENMIIVNAVKCKIRLSQFRAYGKATSSGGSQQTSSSGGGTSTTSGNGGSSTPTSGASSSTSTGTSTSTTAGQSTSTGYMVGTSSSHYHTINWGGGTSGLPAHSHGMSHTHTVTISEHNHSITISNHTHTLDTRHSHDVSPGIFFFSGGSEFDLLIDGIRQGHYTQSDLEIDITEYLALDGAILRGAWHTIGVQPNALARAEITFNVQGFIQSRGGGQY